MAAFQAARSMMAEKDSNFASGYASAEEAARKSIADILEKFRGVE